MTTPVIFRKEQGDIVAIFPTIPATDNTVTCYAHIGQHSGCDRGYYYTTKAAKPDEYADLLRELISIGYDDLKIYKRWQR